MTRILRLSLMLLIVTVMSVAGQKPASPSANPTGWWEGTLVAAGLRLELHITGNAASGWQGMFTSLDQGGAKFPATSVKVAGTAVTIAAAEAHAIYRATLRGNLLAGTWSQMGHAFPLTLERKPGPVSATLPQQPKPPFPYSSRDVTVPSVGGIKLAGTLTVPDGQGPFPAAILIAGSGPHGRDEDIFGHKIFWVLADALSRHGLAVLRMDKRGIGQSGGDYATATTMDFAHDTAAALAFLRTQPQIDAHRIGLIGHSEGGEIAPIVAAMHPQHVAFVVLLAAPALPGSDIIVAQTVAAAKASGASEGQIVQVQQMETRFVDTVKSAASPAAVPAALGAAVAGGRLPRQVLPAAATASSPWYYDFLKLDPVPYLQKLRCPVLALDGSKDTQIPAAINVPALQRALAHDPHATVLTLPGLNHLFQPAKTGLPSEYGSIPITFAPAALQRIEQWLAGVAGSRP